MIDRIKEKNYCYKHSLATITVDGVEVGISKSGRRTMSANEINRLSRLAALMFLRENYKRSILDSSFYLTAKQVRAIIAILNVNQSEFGLLVGCGKAKVSKILSKDDPQVMSRSQSILALERLGQELTRAGSIRKLIGDEEFEVKEVDQEVAEEISSLRYGT